MARRAFHGENTATLKIERDCNASSVMCWLTRIQCTDKVAIFLFQSRTLIVSSSIKLFKLLESGTHILLVNRSWENCIMYRMWIHICISRLCKEIIFDLKNRLGRSCHFFQFWFHLSLIEKSKELIIIHLHYSGELCRQCLIEIYDQKDNI